MAKATPRIRVDLSPEEDEEGSWTLVGKKGKRHLAPPQDPPPEYRQYTLLSHQESSEYLALKRLETAHPEARFRVTGAKTIRPKNEVAAFLFSRLAREEEHGIRLKETAAESRGVLLRYPLGLSLDPITADPRVTFARRCVFDAGHGRRTPTRQVLVTFGGRLPDTMDLGSWGVYTLRKYCPEPPRCYNCQSFGHVKKHCGARELCGVCSGRHHTEDCISALKRGEQRTARCPNCGQGHHAWAKDCMERRRRLPTSFKRTKAPVHPPAPAAAHPTATNQKKRKRNRWRKKTAAPTAEPLATTAETTNTPSDEPAVPEASTDDEPTAPAAPEASTADEPAAPAVPEASTADEPAVPEASTADAFCQSEPFKPTTADASCQTDPEPPAEKVEVAVSATTTTCTVATQTAPVTHAAATQTAPETDIEDKGASDKPCPDIPPRTLRSQGKRENQPTTATAKDTALPKATVKDTATTKAKEPVATQQQNISVKPKKPAPATQQKKEDPATPRRKPSHPSKHWVYHQDPNIQAMIDKALDDPFIIKVLDDAAVRRGEQ